MSDINHEEEDTARDEEDGIREKLLTQYRYVLLESLSRFRSNLFSLKLINILIVVLIIIIIRMDRMDRMDD